MHSLDKIRQKRRFIMFGEDSKAKVLELNSFFGKYIMHYEETINKTFTYYDTPNLDLLKSNITSQGIGANVFSITLSVPCPFPVFAREP